MARLYFDHNASSPLRSELRARMQEVLGLRFANPGSIHQEGQAARTLIEQARARVLASIDGQSGALTFTSGATEANNIALQSLQPGDVLLTSRLEHPSIRDTAERLEEQGVELRWLEHDSHGRWRLDTLPTMLQGVRLCALTAANNELGNINDVETVAAHCLEAGVPLHLDAAQVWARWPFKVLPGVSSVTFSAHKAGGPVGVGALWVDQPQRYPAQSFGGHQERGRRAGTENVLFIDAMSRLPALTGDEWMVLAPLRDCLARELEALGGVRNGDPVRAMPNTLNISFEGIEAEEMVMALDLEGVAISAGSACTAGSMEVSAVIDALGFRHERSMSALRWSLGPGHTEDDVLQAAAAMKRVLGRIQAR